MLKVTTLSSGSDGNATIIQTSQGGILIDCGLSRKSLLARMDEMEIPIDSINAVILTHEHGDHLKGVRLACETFRAPLYLTNVAFQFLQGKTSVLPENANIKRFETGSTLQITNMSVRTFSTPHDAIDPIGLRIEAEGEAVGFATDLGKINPVIIRHLKNCSYLFIESNYDHDLLMNSSRPFHLKRRISGHKGHLSNEDSVNAIKDLLTDRTQYLTLGHLSTECNRHELVKTLFQEKLASLNRLDIQLNTAHAETPLHTITLLGVQI